MNQFFYRNVILAVGQCWKKYSELYGNYIEEYNWHLYLYEARYFWFLRRRQKWRQTFVKFNLLVETLVIVNSVCHSGKTHRKSTKDVVSIRVLSSKILGLKTPLTKLRKSQFIEKTLWDGVTLFFNSRESKYNLP